MRPQSTIYHAMRSSRAQFKYALRQCRPEELAINSTKLANYMQNREIKAFWKECKNILFLSLHFLIV